MLIFSLSISEGLENLFKVNRNCLWNHCVSAYTISNKWYFRIYEILHNFNNMQLKSWRYTWKITSIKYITIGSAVENEEIISFSRFRKRCLNKRTARYSRTHDALFIMNKIISISKIRLIHVNKIVLPRLASLMLNKCNVDSSAIIWNYFGRQLQYHINSRQPVCKERIQTIY